MTFRPSFAASIPVLGLALAFSPAAHADSALFGAWGTVEPRDLPARDRIDPDRPHFPEAATAAGVGRLVLEGGVTSSSKSGEHATLTAPESLLRVGAFADWFELRVGQSFTRQQQTDAGLTSETSGLQDLYLGTKVVLTAQKGWLPAMALIPQMTVPTGTPAVSAGVVLPGVNFDLAWEVIEDRIGIEIVIANNQMKDSLGAIRHELATGLTGTFQATRSLELFAEWDAYYDFGGLASTTPRHYAVGGLVWFLSNAVAVDARAGVGLNGAADDYLVGAGFAVRF